MYTASELFTYFNQKLMSSNLFIKEENISPLTDNPAEDMILDDNLMFHLICDVLDKYNGFIGKKIDRIENVNEINEIILYAQEKAIRLEKAITEVPKIIHINDRVKQRNKEEIRVYEDLVVYLIQLKREKGEEL